MDAPSNADAGARVFNAVSLRSSVPRSAIPLRSARRFLAATWLLTGGLVLGCRAREDPTQGRPPPVPSASVPVAAPDGAWVARVGELYEQHHGAREQRAEDAFARIRFRLPSPSEHWKELCLEGSECREATRYVRVRQHGDEIRFLPHCSATDERRLLDELGVNGPWTLRSGSLAAGKTLVLTNPRGERTLAELDSWDAPVPTAPRVWDEWLYARSVSAAFAASKGFDVSVLGGGDECRLDEPLGPCEASLATKGHPLAAFRELSECPFMSPAECAERQIVAPVSAGFFQNFCGRIEFFPLPPEPSAEERTRLQRRRRDLEQFGIDVPRLLAGAAWTAYGHHAPQLDIEQLARTIRALDLTEPLLARFRAVSEASNVSFGNRFRADVLVAYLTGASDAAEPLRRVRRRLPACGAAAPACQPSPSLDALDTACAAHLLGRGNRSCAHG